MGDVLIAALKIGEVIPIYGSADAESGTLTISGQPTYTLYDSSGNIIAGHNAQNTTGFDNTALDTVRAWKTLDTSALALGFYTITFKFNAVHSVDSITRTFEPNVSFNLKPPGA